MSVTNPNISWTLYTPMNFTSGIITPVTNEQIYKKLLEIELKIGKKSLKRRKIHEKRD